MKYSLVQVSNGNFSIVAEYGENKQGAFVGFHDRCKILWNATDVLSAVVAVMDENLDVVEGKKEYISHPAPAPEPEPTPEPEEV